MRMGMFMGALTALYLSIKGHALQGVSGSERR